MRPRIISGVFGITAAVVIGSTILTYYFGNRVLQAHAGEEFRRDVIAQLDQLTSSLKDAETGQRGFLITGEESYLQPYHDAVAHIPQYTERLKLLEQTGVSASEIERITDLIQQKLVELDLTIQTRRNSGFAAAAALVQKGEGQRLMDELRSTLLRLQTEQRAALQSDAKMSDETTRVRTAVFAITGFFNILFLLWAYQRINESVRERDRALSETQKRGRELQEQKDLLSVTLASIGDCVIVTDQNGRITFMNAVSEKVTGWSLEEARGRATMDVFRILNEHTREPVENPVEKVMKHGVIVGLANHTLLIRKDGSEVPIDDSGAPIRDVDGVMRGVVLVFRDFSEHRESERELREAKQAAENANKAKDQFLAMLSHELRTPLTPVLAKLNLWETSKEFPSALHPDVQMLRRSVELEARIIDDLLDLTRIARGMLSFSPENTDVHSLIEFLVGLSKSEAQQKQLDVLLKLEARRHTVHTDAGRLQQVLWNIMRNAIKFTDSYGAITITTSNDSANNLNIAIKDTGIGMTPETISRLFIAFEQADTGRSRRYGGLGLGMAISSALVELLEGKLTAKSAGLGRGSTFTVTFTTTEAPAEPSTPERAPVVPRGKIKLLLIEDHADTAHALVQLLQSRGYKITSAPSVATGLEAFEKEQFDLVLCDLGLPDGTGFDFIEKVRKTRDTPAIALTGFGMQQDVEQARQAGFDAHLTKPVNLQKLEASIWDLIKKRPAK